MKHVLFALAILLIPTFAYAGEPMIYKDGNTVLEGYWVPAEGVEQNKAPTVLVIHQWMGLTDNEKMRAEMVSKLGYNAFAVDMYGQGIHPKNTDEAGKLATLYKSDPALARKRINAALDFVRTLPDADKDHIAAIGYCFGGTMALELARSSADIDGVISFHGGLSTPAPLTAPGTIKASVQIHHGADDPLVPPAEMQEFTAEMNKANADWSLTQYAHAVHAFTQKGAGNDPSKGIAYNEKADKRSWESAMNFLREIFAD